MSTAEAQARWRAKRRQERDPVRRFCGDVIEWDTESGTPTSGRLASLASDILDLRSVGIPAASKSVAELMGFGSSNSTVSDGSKVDLAALARAQAAMDDPEVPVTEREIRAGLYHAKRLVKAPRRRTETDGAQIRLWQGMLGVTGDGLAPAELCTPTKVER